jgi:CDP-glucose 4,6-dehydratase
MTNILVTGATGFIGSHLVDYLSQNSDNNIYGISRSIKQESTFNALNLLGKKNINIIFGNIIDLDNTEEILNNYNIEQVYHLAAQPIVKKASITPIATYKTNIMGTLNVLEAIRSISAKKNKEISTVVMSTDKAYGNSEILPYKEEFPLNGLDIYSSSKVCEDVIARSYSFNYNMNITVARPSNTYGIDFHFSRLIPSLAKSCFIEKDKPLILNSGSYNYIREYNYVVDIVRALVALMDNIHKTKGNAYNISSNYKYTTKEVVEKFFEISEIKKNIQFKEKESTFKEIEDQYLDTTKLKDATHWEPEYNLEDGLRETIEKYQEWFDKVV